jgi:arabinofuranosyltransferase
MDARAPPGDTLLTRGLPPPDAPVTLLAMSRARPSRHSGPHRVLPRPKSRRGLPDRSLLAAIPILAALLGIALFLQKEWAIAGLWGFSLDDSWIHAVFARNIATGNGYAFNPGETVSGSTGPLYSFLLAAVYSLTREMVWSAKVIGIACHLVAVVQIYRAAEHLESDTEWMPVLAAVMVAVSPPLLWASVSGMEISLYLMLLCWGLERYLAGKDVAATLLWSLGIWVRPDGIFLVGLSMLGPMSTLWKRAAVAVALIVPFFAFNEVLGGSLFPQTVAAKSHLGFHLYVTWSLFREWMAMWGVPFRVDDQLEHPLLLLAFLLVGIVLMLRRRPALALFAIGLPIAFSLVRDNSGSHKRYLIPVIPFGILLAMVGLRWIAMRVTPKRAVATFLAVSLACLVWQAGLVSKKATVHGWNVQNINMMQRLLGLTARQATPPGAIIAASDIGAIEYFSNRKVVDLMGLVSRPRTLPENLSYYKPDLLIVVVDWFKTYARRDSPTSFWAFYDSDSTHKYTAMTAIELSHNTICAADQMIAFVRQKPGDPPPPLYFHRF